jgi:hypothetical protein
MQWSTQRRPGAARRGKELRDHRLEPWPCCTMRTAASLATVAKVAARTTVLCKAPLQRARRAVHQVRGSAHDCEEMRMVPDIAQDLMVRSSLRWRRADYENDSGGLCR